MIEICQQTLVSFLVNWRVEAWGGGGILDKKQVSSVLFWPMLHNYTRERILIGSVFMQNYYQCPSEAVDERRGGGEGREEWVLCQ